MKPIRTDSVLSVGALSGLLASLLAVCTLALYAPALRNNFVNFDDELYVTDNVQVQAGWTWENFKWAFSHQVASNWHPFTVLSHMLDCQMFGVEPWGHHLTSIVLHALNTALVFLFLRRMTGTLWRSILVAVLFGWHPVHVESVAWVAERKDVLSGFFGLLALIFYVRYARQCQVQPLSAKISYGLALIFFAGGLLSKPMLVTWPFVFLLLDFWPLERLPVSNLQSLFHLLTQRSRLFWEKLPFFALALMTSVVTFLVQKQTGAMEAAEAIPLHMRIGNALISYCRYIGKMLWPKDLTISYPYPEHLPVWQVCLAFIFLVLLSAMLWFRRQQMPFLLTGWCWFVGTLVPVIGLVQVGIQAIADRYTYIPSIGFFVALSWGLCAIAQHWQVNVRLISLVPCVAVIACLPVTWRQIGYWRDSETLFQRAIKLTGNNPIARHNLGTALLREGRLGEAIVHFREVVRLKPTSAPAHYYLGTALSRNGQTVEAIQAYREALRIKVDYAEAHNNLGTALARSGQDSEAIYEYREALKLAPDFAAAHNNLGTALLRSDEYEKAALSFREAIRLQSNYDDARFNLGIALARQGQIEEAINQYRGVLELNSGHIPARFNLGNVLLKLGNQDEAVTQFREVIRQQPDHTDAHANLGAVLSASDRSRDAIPHFQEVVRLRPDDAEARLSLGMALVRAGQLNDAVTQFQAAVRLDANRPEACYNLGLALARLDRIDEAVSYYQKAIRLKPEYPSACYNLGISFAKQGQFDAAVQQFQNTLRIKADHDAAHFNLGLALRAQGQLDAAVRHFREATRLNPANPAAQRQLSATLSQQGGLTNSLPPRK
jgi:tetratricopeptide (TPR) repeat protein